MKFQITRVSTWNNQKPIEDCEKIEYEVPTVSGKNVKTCAWIIEIKTLEELFELKTKVKDDLIISGPNDLNGIPCITIYDDYID